MKSGRAIERLEADKADAAPESDPLLPADHPLAAPVERPRREDAVGLVREPFVPSAKAAAETTAEMRRVSEAKELARLLPGLVEDIAGLLEFNMSAPMYRLARAAELLTRERGLLTKRVAELEAAGRVTASLAKDFAAQAAAEQSVRNWLRAHGHDLTRPWDEVVIGLLEAPPAGSVAGLDHLIRVIVSDARDWSTNRTDAWIYGTIVGWGDALSEVAERNGWSEETTRRLESTAAIVRSALSPSPMGAIVAEVMATRARDAHGTDLRAGTTPEKHATIAAGVLRAKSGRFPLTTRDKLVRGAAVAIAGVLAFDAKGGA